MRALPLLPRSLQRRQAASSAARLRSEARAQGLAAAQCAREYRRGRHRHEGDVLRPAAARNRRFCGGIPSCPAAAHLKCGRMARPSEAVAADLVTWYRPVNAVSPPWVSGTLSKLGMGATAGLPASVVVRAYVRAVETPVTGLVIEPNEDAGA